jgi:hypothetical protein
VYSGFSGRRVLDILLMRPSPPKGGGGSGSGVPSGANFPVASGDVAGFAVGVLHGIHAPITPANVQSIERWEAMEGGMPWNNPLNTSLPTSGSVGVVNSANVQRYATLGDGVAATVATLLEPRYAAIVSALRSGQGLIGNTSAAVAQELHTWSGSYYAISP